MTTLHNARWLRLTTFTAFYFAQGVPIGLLTVALPAYLGEQGRSVPIMGVLLLIAAGVLYFFKEARPSAQ